MHGYPRTSFGRRRSCTVTPPPSLASFSSSTLLFSASLLFSLFVMAPTVSDVLCPCCGRFNLTLPTQSVRGKPENDGREYTKVRVLPPRTHSLIVSPRVSVRTTTTLTRSSDAMHSIGSTRVDPHVPPRMSSSPSPLRPPRDPNIAPATPIASAPRARSPASPALGPKSALRLSAKSAVSARPSNAGWPTTTNAPPPLFCRRAPRLRRPLPAATEEWCTPMSRSRPNTARSVSPPPPAIRARRIALRIKEKSKSNTGPRSAHDPSNPRTSAHPV